MSCTAIKKWTYYVQRKCPWVSQFKQAYRWPTLESFLAWRKSNETFSEETLLIMHSTPTYLPKHYAIVSGCYFLICHLEALNTLHKK